MRAVMPRLGACFLRLYGGPLDGERHEVARDDPDRWPKLLDLYAGPCRSFAIYALVKDEHGTYYRYES